MHTTQIQRVTPEMIKAEQEKSRCKLVTLAGQAIPIQKGEVVIGRSHPRDPSVPDIDLWALEIEEARTASRRHCRIFSKDDEYFLEDLASMNGTFLNDAQCTAGTIYPIKDGDRITTGRVQLTFVKQ